MSPDWERFLGKPRPTPNVSRAADAEYGAFPTRSFSRTPFRDPTTKIPRPARTARHDLVMASNSLGLTIHRHLAQKAPHTNVVVSPVSASLAMAMAALGAKGETRSELERVLDTVGIADGEWQVCIADFLQTLRFAAQQQELRIANSVWATDTRRLLPEYEQALKQWLEAEATSLPFADPQSVVRINQWVHDKTGGRIAEILQSLSEDERLLLVNCVYFKGLWDDPFERERTKERTFHGVDSDRQRPFMHMRNRFPYREDDDGQAVCLRYGGHSSLGMWVFLPAKKLGMELFLRRLKPSFWESAQLASREDRPGTLALPRFKLECSNGLNDGLHSAGVRLAFDPDRADFGGILAGSEPLFISEVLQKTYLAVNEEGSEAAAASLTRVTLGAAIQAEPPKPFEMVVDRPFFVAVGDRSSGLILFTASVWEV
jgi:serine protease inhibitor